MTISRYCPTLVLFLALSAGAQEVATATATTDAQPQPAAQTVRTQTAAVTTTSVAETPVSRVVLVKGPHAHGRVHLGDEVQVGVSGYEGLRKSAAARQKPITLWLNGLDAKLERIGEGMFAEAKPPMTAAERVDARVLTFRLTRTNDNKDLWRNLLRDPFGEPTEKLALSVGVSDDVPLLLADAVSGGLTLEKTHFTATAVFWILLVLLIIVLLFRYASDMLRAGPPVNGRKQAFSLARSQMAWWFILIIVSYITIWLITGDRDTVTTSLLVLMGISAATAMGSIAIDANAPARANEMRQELLAEKATIAAQPMVPLTAAGSQHAQEATEAMNLRVAQIDQTVANVTGPPITTGSWLRDVLTDNNGTVGLHRFQILAWTIVLGFIFIASVGRDLSMPEFNTTLLALMGISAGTYLGFKLPPNAG